MCYLNGIGNIPHQMKALFFSFQGVICAVCEVGGLSLFALVVIPKLRNAMQTIFLMNGVFLVPLLYIMVDQMRQLYYNHFSSKSNMNHDAAEPLNLDTINPLNRQQSCESRTTNKVPSLLSLCCSLE